MNIRDLYGKWISTSDRTVIRFNPFTLVTPYGSRKYTIEQRLNFPYICYGTGEMIYHEENDIPILSDTIMEYDGRGEIIIREYVREQDIGKIPEDFCSELQKTRNHRKPIPTVMEVKE